MKLSHISAALLLFLSISADALGAGFLSQHHQSGAGHGQSGSSPRRRRRNLDKDMVAEVYLTDGKNDIKMEIIEQDRRRPES